MPLIMENTATPTVIAVSDLPAALQSAEMIDVMVAGANARAARVAPCLVDTVAPPTSDQLAEAKLVLFGAVKRWVEAGAGALQSQTAGPFGVTLDTRQRTGFNLWPSEITDLQAICKAPGEGSRQAFSLDTAPPCTDHAPWCSALTYTDATGAVVYGGAYCTCGADIAGFPLYE